MGQLLTDPSQSQRETVVHQRPFCCLGKNMLRTCSFWVVLCSSTRSQINMQQTLGRWPNE